MLMHYIGAALLSVLLFFAAHAGIRAMIPTPDTTSDLSLQQK